MLNIDKYYNNLMNDTNATFNKCHFISTHDV